MTTLMHRVILGVLAVTGAVVGIWAAGWPDGFFHAFPGFGRHWVSLDGTYNEHLVRDVGAAYLALTVLALYAMCVTRPELVRAAGAAWLSFGALHFAYHVHHLGMYDTADRILNVVALGGSVILAAALLVPSRDGSRA